MPRKHAVVAIVSIAIATAACGGYSPPTRTKSPSPHPAPCVSTQNIWGHGFAGLRVAVYDKIPRFAGNRHADAQVKPGQSFAFEDKVTCRYEPEKPWESTDWIFIVTADGKRGWIVDNKANCRRTPGGFGPCSP